LREQAARASIATMSFFNIFRRKKPKAEPKAPLKVVSPWAKPGSPRAKAMAAITHNHPHHSDDHLDDHLARSKPIGDTDIRRYFHNHDNFQCYTSWFSHWGGWMSAGHCVTEAHDHVPDFTSGKTISWPDGLDAALVGCKLPSGRPPAPMIGQDVIICGYPAGCRTMEQRTGRVYYERGAGSWICHIFEPDEPVVVGMSGGPVLDARTLRPIGITITRNSPADLDNDRDPDESADFIALSAIWDALAKP